MNVRSIIISMLLCLTSLSVLSTPTEEATLLIKKAQALVNSNPEKAILLLQKTYSLGLKENNSNIISKSLYWYAWCKYQEGDDAQSISLYYNALVCCPPNNIELMSSIKMGLGAVYGYLGKVAIAEKYMFEALILSKQMKRNRYVASIYINLGKMYEENNNEAKAEHYYQQALPLVRKAGDQFSEGLVLNNLGTIGMNYEKHIIYLKQALAIARKLDNLYNMCAIYANMSNSYYNLKQYDKALAASAKAYGYAVKTNAKAFIINILQIRTDIYEAQNNYGLANKTMRQLLSIKKQLNDENVLKDIEKRITTRQLTKLNEQKELQSKKNELFRQRLYLLILVFALTAVALFLIFRFYIYRKQKKMELISKQYELEKAQNELNELQLKQNDEQFAYTSTELKQTKDNIGYVQLFLKTRDELLENIAKRLRENYTLEGSEHIAHLRTVNNYIAQFHAKAENNGIPTSSDEENRSFIERLKANYPLITDKECTLASYIRLNISTRDIALLIGSQIKTVEMARYRLRKQLALSPEDGLTDFLKRI